VGRIAGVSPQETRDKLIEAAVRVFAERGYEGARVSDITRAAGLSSGAIYAHYKSKAELLVDAIRAHGPNEVTRLLAGGEGSRASVADLLVRLGGSLEHRDPTQSSLLLEAIAAARRDPDVAQVLATSMAAREDHLVELIRRAQQAGDIDPGLAPEVLARFCLMVVLGALVSRVMALPPTDPDQWTQLIARLVDGFRAEDDTP
jgi:AcrR family transcriptional regulator